MVYNNFRRIPGTKLYRGSKPDHLDEKEKDKLEQEYGIECIIDLRSPRERKHKKEPVVTFGEFTFLMCSSKYGIRCFVTLNLFRFKMYFGIFSLSKFSFS